MVRAGRRLACGDYTTGRWLRPSRQVTMGAGESREKRGGSQVVGGTDNHEGERVEGRSREETAEVLAGQGDRLPNMEKTEEMRGPEKAQKPAAADGGRPRKPCFGTQRTCLTVVSRRCGCRCSTLLRGRLLSRRGVV